MYYNLFKTYFRKDQNQNYSIWSNVKVTGVSAFTRRADSVILPDHLSSPIVLGRITKYKVLCLIFYRLLSSIGFDLGFDCPFGIISFFLLYLIRFPHFQFVTRTGISLSIYEFWTAVYSCCLYLFVIYFISVLIEIFRI